MHPIVFAVWLALAAPALAFTPQPGPPLKPSESVWQPAPTPKGGVSWALLESTKETTRLDSNNLIRTKPLFPPAVKALAGKRIKVSGYMLPLENSDRQSHFVLLAYPPDCPFHLNPNPMQFIEVRTRVPVSPERRLIKGAQLARMDARAGLLQQGDRLDADLEVLVHGPLVEGVGRARQLDLAMQRLVGDAEQGAVGHAQPVALRGDGARFHVDRDGARLVDALALRPSIAVPSCGRRR
jgi:uncharacterized protein